MQDIGIRLLFDPRGDRIDFFDAHFVQPISPAGLALYRYSTRDTTRIVLPSRTITLIEVVLRPRQNDWEALEGSLWFDRDTGVLARAAYRPSDVWNHEIREPHDLDNVPGFLKPAIGTVQSIVVEYGLFDQRWWLPSHVHGEGVLDWGNGLVRMPISIDWTMSDQVLNEAPDSAVTPGGNLASVARSVHGDDNRREHIEYLAPRGVDLANTAVLPPPLKPVDTIDFSQEELSALVGRITQVAGPPPAPPAPSLSRALLTTMRYDRVRGLSAGYHATFNAGHFQLTPDVRFSTAVPDLFGSFAIARGEVTLTAYHDLADASDWNHAGGLGNSVSTLLFGHDGGDSYRVNGAALSWQAAHAVQTRIDLFAEQQRSIARQTSIALTTLGGGHLRGNLVAADVAVAGVRTELRGQLGADAQRTVFNWRLAAEAALGDARHARASAAVRLTHPLGATTTAALELSGGLAGAGAPPQRNFYLGGVGTLRGVSENAVSGPEYGLARAELGRGLPGMRAVVFLDAGWAGARGAMHTARPVAGAGAGASFLDGLFRVDLARGVLRSSAWRLYFYIDALL